MISNETFFRFNKGDELALKEVYDELYTEMSLICKSYDIAKHMVPELISDVFIAMWKKRGEYNAPEHIKNTAIVSIKNRCLNYIRNEKVREIKEIGDVEDSYIEDGGKDLMKLIEHLSPAEREVFIERYIKGKPNAQVAVDTGRTIQTVKNILTLGKKRLKLLVSQGFKKKEKAPRRHVGKKRVSPSIESCEEVYNLRVKGHKFSEIDELLKIKRSRSRFLLYLRHYPDKANYTVESKVDDVTVEACRLKSLGYSYRDINKMLGIGNSYSRVTRYAKCNPNEVSPRFMTYQRQKRIRLVTI